MIIGVTGASSGVGSAVCLKLVEVGHTVRTFGRRPSGQDEYNFRLGQPIDTRGFNDLDALIHLAWDWVADPELSHATNVGGSVALAEVCRRFAVTPVLLSTVSVSARQFSMYGNQKAIVEDAFEAAGGGSVRSGLIWSPIAAPFGMIQTVLKLARVPGVCVHLKPDPLMTYSDLDHLTDALVARATGMADQPIAIGASTEPVRLSEISHAARPKDPMSHVALSPKRLLGIASNAQRFGAPLPFRVDSLNAVLTESDPYDKVAGVPVLGGFLGRADFLTWITASATRVGKSTD